MYASYNFKFMIIQKISILEYFPYIGFKYKNTVYRCLLIKNWVILYKIENTKVIIIQLFNSKQNFN